MAHQNELVTVFRSADESAGEDAADVCSRLLDAGIDAVLLGDDTPGVVIGTWEVRAPAADRVRAEKIASIPLPEPEDEEEVSEEGQSHELDFVTVFSGQGAEAEMEALSIKGLLEGSGIPAVLIGSQQIPSLPFEVRVPKSRYEVAKELLDSPTE